MPDPSALETLPMSLDPSGETARRRQAGRFKETKKAQAIRLVMGSLCKLAPGTSAIIAYTILSRPPRSPERQWQSQLIQKANRSWLRVGTRKIAMYRWGCGPTVLMVHGWGARATHMGKMIDSLVLAGFSVVSFDAPAHGKSEGRHTDLIEYAATIAAVARQVGPVHTIIAHSFGVAMALLSRRDWGFEVKKQIYISSFDHCKWFTEAFRSYLGFSEQVIESARQIVVERHNGRFNWDRLSVVEMIRKTEEHTLIVHDEEDEEIPFEHSMALHKAARHSELFTTNGYGHHRLLGHPDVVNKVVQFVTSESAESKLAPSTPDLDLDFNESMMSNAEQT